MTQATQSETLLQRARSGNLAAIRQLIMQTFKNQGIRVQVSQNSNELKIFIEAKSLPDQISTTDILQRGIRDLRSSSIDVLKIYAQVPGSPTQQWSQEVYLNFRSNQNLVQKIVNQEQVSKLVDGSLKRTQALAKTSKNTLQNLPLQRMAKIASVGTLILCIGAGSLFGIKLGFDFWQQQQMLAQAEQAISLASSQETLKSTDGIQSAQKSLTNTKSKLVKLSLISGSTGKQAQEKLTKLERQHGNLGTTKSAIIYK